jgi:hypothetical protein
LAQGERPPQLSPSIRRLTYAEQLESLQQGLNRARKRALEANESQAQQKREEALWPNLFELAERRQRLHEEEEALRCKTALLDDVEREAKDADAAETGAALTPLQRAFVDALRPARKSLEQTDDAIAEVRKQIGVVQNEIEGGKAVAALLRLLGDAKKNKRWWSPRWWKAVLNRDLDERLAKFDAEEERNRIALAKLEDQFQTLSRDQERMRHTIREERARLVGIERTRRRNEIEIEEAALKPILAGVDKQWQEARSRFRAGSSWPDLLTPEAIRDAHHAWQARASEEEAQADFAGAWADALDHAAGQMDQRLLDGVNLVAATVGGLRMDQHFGDVSRPQREFDLLILVEAHEVTESEFSTIAPRANRSILIGEPADLPALEKAPARKTISAKSGIRTSIFHRMWNALHCDPRRLPYIWFPEGDRLGCRLRPIAPEQRRWLESEQLVDSPEIELRILAPVQRPSELVEVIFPPGRTIHQAKEFIFKELEELPISTTGRGIRWDEQPDRLVLHLTDQPLNHCQPILLEVGLRERIGTPPNSNGDHVATGTDGWQTCCLEFDRSAGWERGRAEEWVRRKLGLVDLGRTALLNRPYRMRSDLVLFLSHLLYNGQYYAANNGHHDGPPADAPAYPALSGPAVEFVAVPTDYGIARSHLHRHEAPRPHHGGVRSTSSMVVREPREGLELNLEDPQQRETLPADLRAGLPKSGCVNLAEAQAIVHALETLVSDEAFSSFARRSGLEGRRPTVGVVALYPAQVELIRRLIEQIPTLIVTDADIIVETPEAFRDRECLITLVSLTRSNGHRATSLGDGPHRLAWALTRSTTKLLIFGDPATLQRRCQWDGPVGLLDAAASDREREIFSNLVRYLEGNGAHPRAFHVREGSRA